MNQPTNRPTSWWRRAIQALDGPPKSDWLSQIVHHGSRAVLLLLAAVTVFLLFPAPRLPDTAVLERGVVAPFDVIAEFPFAIPKSDAQLQREQAEAASGVPPIFDRSTAAGDTLIARVRGLLDSVDSIVRTTPGPEERDLVREYMVRNRIAVTPNSMALLLEPARRAMLFRSIAGVVREYFPDGVAPSSLDETVSAIRVRNPDGSESLVPSDSLITPDQFFTLASRALPDQDVVDAAELQRLILIRFFQPSLVYNEDLTEAARERARAVVDPVEATVLQGERIVGAHEQIGDVEEARLKAYQAELTRRGVRLGDDRTLGRALGAVIYNLLVLSVIAILLWLFRRNLYHHWRSIVLLAVLVVTVAAAGALIARLQLPPELIPVTFAALIIAVLWDGRLGLSIALILSLLIGGQSPFLGITAPFTAAMGGAAAAFSVKVVQRRSKTWLYISLISFAYVASAVTMGLLRSRTASEVLLSMGWGATNAIVASLLAIGFLPLLESFTRITTDQTLLELSDLNRKLLKRLSLEAPGTYAHTVNVANLAEAASHAIGANGLLARVGTYYHDIGKLVKPQYYIENQPKGRNPHDKLKPSMSANIIRSHVMEGVKLADSDRLPDAVKRFILEHHGTQQIAFFYNKSKEMDPEGQINSNEFIYPGPKPQTKETAILMLADSVESAARVLQDPSATRIRELVDRIVAGKMSEGQLDESPLTLRELDMIKESLSSVLMGMYHQRIDYPPAPPANGAEKAQPRETAAAHTNG